MSEFNFICKNGHQLPYLLALVNYSSLVYLSGDIFPHQNTFFCGPSISVRHPRRFKRLAKSKSRHLR